MLFNSSYQFNQNVQIQSYIYIRETKTLPRTLTLSTHSKGILEKTPQMNWIAKI
jgi:hypothetical protein